MPMKRLSFTLLFGVLAGGNVLGGRGDQPAEDKGKNELKKLQGAWRLLSVETKGQTTKGYGKNFSLVIKGDQFEMTYLDAVAKGGFFGVEEKTVSGTLSLDTAKSPTRITLVHTEESAKLLGKKRATGIYRWDDGRLTICWHNPADKAPKEFTAKEGTDRAIFVLEKEP